MGAWMSEAEKHKIVRLRRQGMNPIDIAEQTNKELVTIRAFLCRYQQMNPDNRFPTVRKRCKWNQEIVREWIALQDAGWTRKQICAKYNVHPVIVCRKISDELVEINLWK